METENKSAFFKITFADDGIDIEHGFEDGSDLTKGDMGALITSLVFTAMHNNFTEVEINSIVQNIIGTVKEERKLGKDDISH